MDRITKVWFKNLRTLADVTLDLDGLTVLVGENGTGKSSIIEGLSILRRCGDPDVVNRLVQIHGGVSALLRGSERMLTLGARLTSDIQREPSLDYTIVFEALREYGSITIKRETVVQFDSDGANTRVVLDRDGYECRLASPDRGADAELLQLQATDPALSALGRRQQEAPILRVKQALSKLRAHAPSDVCAAWASNESGFVSPIRLSTRLQPFTGLSVRATNLANAYQALRNDYGPKHWRDTLDLLSLGLGDDVEDVALRADPAGGAIALQVKYRQLPDPVTSLALSDGTLAWLALVALRQTTKPGDLVAFDEPELHLHPALIVRAVDLFESMARLGPVLLATHSDQVLDALHDAAKSVVVCELDSERRTQLRRPDPTALADWMQAYAGYGSIRTAGHEESILRERSP